MSAEKPEVEDLPPSAAEQQAGNARAHDLAQLGMRLELYEGICTRWCGSSFCMEHGCMSQVDWLGA